MVRTPAECLEKLLSLPNPAPKAAEKTKRSKSIFSTAAGTGDAAEMVYIGAAATVISATDETKQGKSVAIKMVPKAFNDEIDAKRILREIKLLKHFRHENIVGIVDMMPPTARYLQDFHDVYIVADLMETDLHRIIYSKQKLSIDHVQYFIYQLLRGMKYIHSADVIHRDLKPSNLLVNSNCDLKICDFGLARGINDSQAEGRGGTMMLTEYVVTRWYRAPEIMLACHEYSKPIDIWSIGCIFAELIQRKPYFPGDDYIDQVCQYSSCILSFSYDPWLTKILQLPAHSLQSYQRSWESCRNQTLIL
jgi:serine/threonine protein kinase